MKFNVGKFNVPKGAEGVYGKNPFMFNAEYDLELDKKDVAVVQWSVGHVADGGSIEFENGLQIVSGGEDFSLGTLVDLPESKEGGSAYLRYRIFTLESGEGPQLPVSNFEVKAPSKGATNLDVSESIKATFEAQPGGMVFCSFAVSASGSGDWCAVALISDNNRQTGNAAEVAEAGSASFNIFMPGKPKTIAGDIYTLGANQWVELTHTI